MSKLRRQVSTHISNVAETKNLTDLKNKSEHIQTRDRNKFFFIIEDYLQNARMY